MASQGTLPGTLPPEVEALTDAQLRSFRSAFQQFDSVNEGVVMAADVPMVLRVLALTPTDIELRGLLDVFARGQSRLDFVTFSQIAGTLVKSVTTSAAMTKLFAQFDPDATGTLSVATFREIFDTLSNEPITDHELLAALVSYGDEAESGMIKYAAFCDKLFADYSKFHLSKAQGAAAIRAASSRKS